MEFRKMFWGSILVVIGTALVLKNLNVIDFCWLQLWRLWPLILIVLGISFLPLKAVWRLLLSFLVIILTVIFFYKDLTNHDHDWRWNWDRNDKDNTEERIYSPGQVLSEPYDTTLQFVDLNLEAAAGEFYIKDTCTNLVEIDNKGDLGSYGMEVQRTGDTARVNIKMKSLTGEHTIKGRGGEVYIDLNSRPDYSIRLDAGAADMELDFSSFRITNLELNGGASSVEMTLGALQQETRISINAGASSIDLSIPKDAGCEVLNNSFLSDKNLEGFTKAGKGRYLTENFNSSRQKIFIELKAGVSEISIERY